MATVPRPPPVDPAEEDLLSRVRRFLWLSSGMFSVASLSLAFTGYAGFGTFEAASANFLASIVSAAVFGIASLLPFGPVPAGVDRDAMSRATMVLTILVLVTLILVTPGLMGRPSELSSIPILIIGLAKDQTEIVVDVEGAVPAS